MRPRNACVMWARILLPCPGFTPLTGSCSVGNTSAPRSSQGPLTASWQGGDCVPGHGVTRGIFPSPGLISTTLSCLHCRQNNTSPSALVSAVSRSSFPRRHTGHTTHAPPMVVLQTSSAAVLLMPSSPDSFSYARPRPRVCMPVTVTSIAHPERRYKGLSLDSLGPVLKLYIVTSKILRPRHCLCCRLLWAAVLPSPVRHPVFDVAVAPILRCFLLPL